MEEKVGLPLADLAEGTRSVRMNFKDLQTQPRRLLNSPMWSGLVENGRTYAPFTYNRERLVPWRTLTGRQHFYLDHPGYIQFGEHLPTYKPKPKPNDYADLVFSKEAGPTIQLNFLTPHGKWHIHSTYGDNQRMTTLSRGCEPFWINPVDADAIGVDDNDWVEVHNDHGVVVTRAAVSHRIPQGICIIYHSPERTYSVPKSPLRGNRRVLLFHLGPVVFVDRDDSRCLWFVDAGLDQFLEHVLLVHRRIFAIHALIDGPKRAKRLTTDLAGSCKSGNGQNGGGDNGCESGACFHLSLLLVFRKLMSKTPPPTRLLSDRGTFSRIPK
ncbi:MAG TPA: molybdopterin dinucleotide binding domain-containing protein, partial [Polyangiaceae bacterium]|nr:molybdopterin dinucleotide binding domain-containing protein [Polyangiaceae bacterium]